MITIEQFLENNSEQEGICIAVYGKEQYDDFMNILEKNGYGWSGFSAESFYEARIGEYTHFILLLYLQETKAIEYMNFILDEEVDYRDIEYVLSDDEDSSKILIKPFPYLKRELKELGLC